MMRANETRVDERKRPDRIGIVPLRAGLEAAARSATVAVPEAQRTNHPEYPLERLCTHVYEPFQLTFARHAQQLPGEHDDVELVASHQGLTIRAETEAAIDAALEVLKRFFGPQIHVGPPTIRYHNGTTLEQPWMGLRVTCAPEHFEAVKVDLIVRDATLIAAEKDASGAVIQACAPLAYLLGYRSELEKLTSGSAEHVMWLSHYAPVESVPPDGDAA
jgi:elongation factor G-like protein